MIVVTGANGQLGRLVVRKLLERVPANTIAASVRDVGKASELASLGVRVRHGDFAEPESLRSAFEGATQVLMISSNARAYGGDPQAQHQAAIAAARAAGAKRILYTSHMGAAAGSAFPPMHEHVATEALLRESGLPWTALRNGFYASSGVQLLGDLKAGAIDAPADGKVAWTAHADLAEAAAILLLDEGRYNGPTPPLTAAEALDLEEVGRLASELLHAPIRRNIITDDELRARMKSRNVPDVVIRLSVGLYAASRAGEFASIDPTLEKLLGRKPVSMREVLASKLRGA